MKAVVKLQNNVSIEVEDDKELMVMHKAIVLGNPKKYCNLCKNNQYFRLSSNIAKGKYTYIKNICTKCGAASTLGQYEGGGYFWKEFEKYEPSTK